MADTFKFELVTPERMVLSEDAARGRRAGRGGRVHRAAGPRAGHLGAAPRRDRRDAAATPARRALRQGWLRRGRCRPRDRAGASARCRSRSWMLASLLPSCRPPRPSSPPPATTPHVSRPPSPSMQLKALAALGSKDRSCVSPVGGLGRYRGSRPTRRAISALRLHRSERPPPRRRRLAA